MQFEQSTRRDFTTLLGSAAAAWPLPARAQQPERMRRIGVLSNLGADDAEGQSRNAAFEQVLEELGWTIGRTLQIDYRWSNGDAARLRIHAAELIALAPDVVLASSGVSISPLLEASHSVPIVLRRLSIRSASESLKVYPDQAARPRSGLKNLSRPKVEGGPNLESCALTRGNLRGRAPDFYMATDAFLMVLAPTHRTSYLSPPRSHS
jgi:hypothetical protein